MGIVAPPPREDGRGPGACRRGLPSRLARRRADDGDRAACGASVQSSPAGLDAAEAARERGATHLGLNVFGDNTGAIALYQALGYTVTAQRMILPLDER
jgi:hypothetical protein